MFDKNKNKKGFTIIELIISIFILSIAVIGVFSAFSAIVILTSDAADKLVASYLSQEGIEIVRNIRDNNWLNIDKGIPDKTWFDGLSDAGVVSETYSMDCASDVGGCEADYSSKLGDLTQWPGAIDGNYLYLNNGFYSYYQGADSTKTKFKRQIIIDTLERYVIKVTVKVSWDQKATLFNEGFSAGNCQPSNCVTTEATLYAWYKYNL